MSKGGMAAEEDCAVHSVPGLEIRLWASVLLSARDEGLRARPHGCCASHRCFGSPRPALLWQPRAPCRCWMLLPARQPRAQRAGWARAGIACPRDGERWPSWQQCRMSAPCRCVKPPKDLYIWQWLCRAWLWHELPWPWPELGSCPLSVLPLDTGEQTL